MNVYRSIANQPARVFCIIFCMSPWLRVGRFCAVKLTGNRMATRKMSFFMIFFS